MYPPDQGITPQFYPDQNWAAVDLSKYDFNRLKQGAGLCVFSYEFRGDAGNKITGFNEETERGVRVWEYAFTKADWDIKEIDRTITFWGYRSLLTLFLKKSGFRIRTHMEFHKGRIVYGGRMIVEFTGRDDQPPRVQMQFGEDMEPWLQAMPDSLNWIKIDTSLIGIY
jgi:hypothetical protein